MPVNTTDFCVQLPFKIEGNKVETHSIRKPESPEVRITIRVLASGNRTRACRTTRWRHPVLFWAGLATFWSFEPGSSRGTKPVSRNGVCNVSHSPVLLRVAHRGRLQASEQREVKSENDVHEKTVTKNKEPKEEASVKIFFIFTCTKETAGKKHAADIANLEGSRHSSASSSRSSKVRQWLETSQRDQCADPPLAATICPPKPASDVENLADALRQAINVASAKPPCSDKQLLTSIATSSTTESSPKCNFCRRALHALEKCARFQRAMRKDRWRFARVNKLCYKCLTKRHIEPSNCAAENCDVEGCGQPHHRLLHWPASKPKPDDTEDRDRSADETTVNHMIDSPCPSVLLKIVPLTVRGPGGASVHAHALLDDGATVTLIASDIADQLGLRGKTYHHARARRVEQRTGLRERDIYGGVVPYPTSPAGASRTDLELHIFCDALALRLRNCSVLAKTS
ncbi:hypothetical protein ACJJTC_004249 [Scirpophaga incertulas]